MPPDFLFKAMFAFQWQPLRPLHLPRFFLVTGPLFSLLERCAKWQRTQMLRLILNYRKGVRDLKKINLEKAKDDCVHNRTEMNLADFVSSYLTYLFPSLNRDLEPAVSMRSIGTLCFFSGSSKKLLWADTIGWLPNHQEPKCPTHG